MQSFLSNHNMVGAFMAILVLAVGSISVVGTSQLAMGQDGNSILDNILGGCIYGACKDTKITGNTTNDLLAGCVFAGCKNVEITGQGQPTQNTATLIVTKVVEGCPNGAICQPSDFQIKISGVTASPNSFPGDAAGTRVTLTPGTYTLSETFRSGEGTDLILVASSSGDCNGNADGTITGNINAGETQTCTITNTFH